MRRLRDSAWRRAALAQRSVADLVASMPPAVALKERPLTRVVLPMVRRLVTALSGASEDSRAGRIVGDVVSAGNVGMRGDDQTALKDPAMWHHNSPEGRYIYRLAACDPSL